MNTRNLYLLLPAVAVLAGYWAWEPGAPEPGLSTNAAVAIEPGEGSSTAAPQTAAQNTPPLVAALPDTGKAAPAAQDCEPILRYLPAGDGTVNEAISCVSNSAPEEHAYQQYSDATLESLAYADATAAEVLGLRLRATDEAKAISLILRSAALAGGDVAPVLRFAQSYPRPSAIDGVPVRKTIHTQYVLSAVVGLLDADTDYVGPWEDTIRQYSSDPDTEIAMLQLRVAQIVEDMRRIQLEVSGYTTIGGQGDA